MVGSSNILFFFFRIAYAKNLACATTRRIYQEASLQIVLQRRTLQAEKEKTGVINQDHVIYEEAFQNEGDKEGRRNAHARKHGCIPMGFAKGLFPVLLVLNFLFSVKVFLSSAIAKTCEAEQEDYPGFLTRKASTMFIRKKHHKRGERPKGKRPKKRQGRSSS
jgi:hypothetical protein